MNVFDLLRDINDDDSIGKPSRTRSRRMTESVGSLTEAYSVKFGPHDQGEESFDDLNSAIKYINDQVKKYDHSNLVLYQDGKELVYLSRMKDRQGQDMGFSISRHNDKSLDFDKSKGLFVVEKEIDDPDVRHSFMVTAQQLKYINDAAFLGRNMKFAYTTDKPSYIDFDKKVVYYNKDEQIQQAVEKIVAEYRANKDKLKEQHIPNKPTDDDEVEWGSESKLGGRGNRSPRFEEAYDDYWRDRPYYPNDQKDKGVIKPYQKPADYKGSQSDWERKCRDSQETNRQLRRNAWESLEKEDDDILTEGDDYWRDRPYYDQSQKDKGVIKPYQKPDNYKGSQSQWERSCRDSEDINRQLRRNPWESVETKKSGCTLNEDDNATQDVQDVETGKSGEQIVGQLRDADYEEFVKILNSDGKSKAFFDYLKNHYKMGDNAIGTIKKCSASEGVIDCAKLIPTQQNISVTKSFDFLKTPGWSEKVIKDPITAFSTPTITYGAKYIIDGHHRWSKVYALHGPNAKIKVLNFPAIAGVSWEDMLKAVQLAIRFNAQSLDLRNKVDNPNMLDDKTGKISATTYLEYACDAVVNAMKEKGYGETKEEQAKKVAVNVATMAKRGAVPGAEPREWMPQTDKIDKTGDAVERTLKTQGVIDITENLDDDITSLEGLGYTK